jgi:hypothetical protein
MQVSEELAREDAAEREAAMRQLCSTPPLSLWKVCRGKRCRRLKICAGNADACFVRHWPRVAADFDLLVHAHFKTGAAGIVRPEIAAEIERRLRLDMKAKASAGQAPREDVRRFLSSPGIAVQRTASLRSPMSRLASAAPNESGWPDKPGHDRLSTRHQRRARTAHE